VRIVYRSGWRQEGDHFLYDVIGNAFLRGMVRSLVGSMLGAGLGQMTVEQLREALAARDRSLAAPPAAACGLCLMHVEYDVPQGSACKRTCEG
jgi:tRNA pseudouridine38-40 synthase